MSDDVRQAAERVRKVRATGLRGGSEYYGLLMYLYHEATVDDALDAFAEDERILSDAYLAANPPDDGWRPIETAPKDGREVLTGAWVGDEWMWRGDWYGNYHGCRASWWPLEDQDGNKTVPPTHWLPLPAPPPAGEPAKA